MTRADIVQEIGRAANPKYAGESGQFFTREIRSGEASAFIHPVSFGEIAKSDNEKQCHEFLPSTKSSSSRFQKRAVQDCLSFDFCSKTFSLSLALDVCFHSLATPRSFPKVSSFGRQASQKILRHLVVLFLADQVHIQVVHLLRVPCGPRDALSGLLVPASDAGVSDIGMSLSESSPAPPAWRCVSVCESIGDCCCRPWRSMSAVHVAFASRLSLDTTSNARLAPALSVLPACSISNDAPWTSRS